VKKPRYDEFTIAHDQRIEQLTMFSGWSKPNSLSRNFAEVFLLGHDLIPYDELEDTKLVDEREVGREIEHGIFVVDRIDSPLCNGRLLVAN